MCDNSSIVDNKEKGLEYSWGENEFYDHVESQLESHNCYFASMVVGLGISQITHKRNSVLYLTSEMGRLGDFLTLLSKLELLGESAPDGWQERHKDVVLTLLRSIYEGQVKVNYIFGAEDWSIENDNLSKIEERFQDVVGVFLSEYNGYVSHFDHIDKESNPFSKLMEGKRINIKNFMQNFSSNNGLDHRDSNEMYQIYKYLCFYTHGNANPALWIASDVRQFPKLDVFAIIDGIAYQYLKYLAILLGSDDFHQKFTAALTKHNKRIALLHEQCDGAELK